MMINMVNCSVHAQERLMHYLGKESPVFFQRFLTQYIVLALLWYNMKTIAFRQSVIPLIQCKQVYPNVVSRTCVCCLMNLHEYCI